MPITILPLYFTPILLIYFGAALIIMIYAVVKTIKLYKLKNIKSIDFLTGLIISIGLYGFLYSLFEGEKAGLGRQMFSSLIMVFIPFLIHVISHSSKKVNFISKVSLISIVVTFTGIIVLAIFSFLSKNI